MGEDVLEDIDSHIEVFEFLHVEIDKSWRSCRCCLLIERQKSRDDSAHRLVIRPHRQLARDGRHLDRHVIHIASGNEGAHTREAPIRLALAQHRFTQKIDVELIALLLKALQRPRQFLLAGINDQMTDENLQCTAGDWHNNPRENRGPVTADTNQQSKKRGQESRDVLGELTEVSGGNAEIFGPSNAIHKPQCECWTLRVLQHPREALRTRMRLRVKLCRPSQPGSNEGDRLICE